MKNVLLCGNYMTSNLDLYIQSSDFDEPMTFRLYFSKLLLQLWREKDNFSGKRPFGNSGWDYDVYSALVLNHLISGKIDEYGDIDFGSVNFKKADKIVNEMIMEMFR